MTKSDYLLEAQQYEYISRIEISEKEIRSKSDVEIDALISFLNDKGMALVEFHNHFLYEIFFLFIEKALKENFPFVITFESGNPTEEYSLVDINGLRLYVVKCNACDELLPKCMTCEHSRMHVNGPQIENSEEFCYYHEDLSKKFEPENLNEKLLSIFIKYK